jgi:glycerol-3-phosphate acyltransferase PlsY
MKKGPVYGCLTSMLDMAKAAMPVLAFKLVFPDQDYEFLAAATAVVGHNYPVYYRFHGGGGMSPYLGGLAVLDWPAVPVLTVAGILTGGVLRNGLLAYVSGVIWLIPWFAWRDGGWPSLLYAAAVNVAVWAAVWPTLRELARKKRAGEIDPKGILATLREGHPSMNHNEAD